MEFESQKELFDYARTFDLNSIPVLSDILEKYNLKFISIDELEPILFGKNVLVLDARSEKEYSETHIPNSVNFPVLNNEERHNVGLIYKKYSNSAALKMAMDYADPKSENLKAFLDSHDAKSKQIIVHCWRGGGRSKYLSKMVIDAGYDVLVLKNGIKAYRNNAVKYFSLNEFPFKLIELSGLTGCGKTEIIRELANNYPVLDLEKSARHFSSLFGYIPYKIRNYEPVFNQTAFENNTYSQIIYNRNIYSDYSSYFVESESKKIGNFNIPPSIYTGMNNAVSIKIISSIENRIKRIVKDYFDDDNKGLEEMIKLFRLKERLFRKEMSNKKYEFALSELENNRTHSFTEIMLKDYYDVKYKEKPKVPLYTISSDNMSSCIEEIISIYRKNFLN
ncbi:MAG: tRNA 2-selenouridine(34) synthase MnmH [Ignavibacteria bacterium]|nr:tRNA 2-selenouridine(34) synthase MnmH [Ignavibacteria bacterium]